MGKKKKPSKAVQSKLIVPGSESQPKTQLLVPDSDVGKTTARLSVPGVEGQAEVPKPSLVVEEVPQEQAQAPLVAEEEGEQSTVISEDPVEAIVEEVAPVKVTAMVPPPPEPEMVEEIVEEFAAAPVEEVVEPVVAVAMSAPPELVEDPAVVAEEQPAGEAVVEPQAEFVEGVYQTEPEQPIYEGQEVEVQEYAEQAPSQAESWEPPVAQEAYYDPAQVQPAQEVYQDPAPVPAPSLAPPLPAPVPPQAPPMQAPPAPYNYGAPPVPHGYQMPGQPYAGGVGQSGGVPSWALILVGVLIGFLVAMSLFKFTSMGAALRGDLVEEGKAKAEKMYKAKIKSLEDGGYPDDEEEDEPEEEPEEEEPEEEPEPDEEPEPEEEDKEEEDTEEE